MNTKLKEWGAFTLLALIWGSSFLWIKIAVQPSNEVLQPSKYFLPFWLVAFRVLFGWLSVLVVLIWQKKSLPRERNLWLGFLVMGVVNTAIPFVLITWGESNIDSGLAGILNGIVPLFVIVIAHFWLHDEKITLPRLGGLILGFIGVVILVSRDIDPVHIFNSNVLGQLAVVVASISYAIGLIFSRRYLRGQSPVIQSTLSLFFANFVMWGVTPIAQPITGLPTNFIAWFAVAWLGVLGLCVAYLILFYLNNAWGPTRASVVTYIMPVIAIILGVIFRNEIIDWRLFVGSLLIFGGIIVVNLKN